MSRTKKNTPAYRQAERTRLAKTQAMAVANKTVKKKLKAPAKLDLETGRKGANQPNTSSGSNKDLGQDRCGPQQSIKIELEEAPTSKNTEAALVPNPKTSDGNTAWRRAISSARNTITIDHEKGYNKSTGRSSESNYVVREVLRELSNAKQKGFPKKADAANEEQLLTMLFHLVDKSFKSQYGVPKGYKTGADEVLDSNLLQAALVCIQAYRPKQSKGNCPPNSQKSNGLKNASPRNKLESGKSVTVPVDVHDDLASKNDEDQDSVSASSEELIENEPATSEHAVPLPKDTNLVFTQPLSIYATTPATPFAALHKVQTGRVTKNHFKRSCTSTFTTSPTWRASAITPYPISRLSPTHLFVSPTRLNQSNMSSMSVREREHADCGERVDQALLKISKWADAWLGGTFSDSNQDLAWESFEFCLRMSDMLEHTDAKEIQIKSEN